ncbi:MAG: type II toxin-antitoxin system VapC family toxin [Terriglobales bacterium]
MTRRVIIDTGPLVAVLARDERFHKWAVDQFKQLIPPLLVCEAVLTEAAFLLQRKPDAWQTLFGLLEDGPLSVQFSLCDNLPEVRALLRKYHGRVSLADACLVRMSELHSDHAILTLDTDFHVYRKFGRQPIELICPA